jgi:hypothetical protein
MNFVCLDPVLPDHGHVSVVCEVNELGHEVTRKLSDGLNAGNHALIAVYPPHLLENGARL